MSNDPEAVKEIISTIQTGDFESAIALGARADADRTMASVTGTDGLKVLQAALNNVRQIADVLSIESQKFSIKPGTEEFRYMVAMTNSLTYLASYYTKGLLALKALEDLPTDQVKN